MNIYFNKTKKIFFQIIVPIVLIILPFVFSDQMLNLIKKLYESYNGTTIDAVITNTIVKIIIAVIIYIIIKKYNSKKEFLNGDVYGDFPMLFYYLAKCLGYGNVSLIRKPYDIQFKLLKNELFNIVDDKIETDEEVNVVIDKGDFKFSINMRECNLVISDTYPITKEQLPNSKKNLDTIWIKREKSAKAPRVYSPKLINAVNDCVATIEQTGAKINLFLTTNTKNTEKIVKDIFMKGDRTKYEITIFLQNADSERTFKEKGKKV